MPSQVKSMIREWLAKDGDAEKTARWMAHTLHLASIGQCRRWIAEATK